MPGETEHLVEIFVLLLVVSTFVAIAVKFVRLPYTLALVLAGLGIALAAPQVKGIELTPDLVLFVILPALLFQGALNLDLHHLKDSLKPIVLLALPGVLISTFLTGFVFHWLTGIDLKYCLLFGALITPTDPISVLAIFKETGAPERLRTIIEGESLFNDGTGVVIFKTILAVVVAGTDVNLLETAGNFVLVIAGGAAIGAGIGYAAYRILIPLEDHLLEVMITILVAYGSFIAAELLHVSGVIATVSAGLMIGNQGKALAMSVKTRTVLTHFWDQIDFIFNSILFVLIGLELQVVRAAWGDRTLAPYVGMAIAAMLAGRAVATYPVAWVVHFWENKITLRWAHVFFWGGLRGSIPLALVLQVGARPELKEVYPLLLACAFGSVLFSLLGQGITMKPLLKWVNPQE
jgi:CPA1 family monovalent cation:H+ antiporter